MPNTASGVDDFISISNGRLTAKILRFGASLCDLRLKGHDQPLILGFENAEDYRAHGHYLGAVIGRYANRIANACCPVGDREIALEQNNGSNHLHGGTPGFSNRDWVLKSAIPTSVHLTTTSPDGEAGYPGKLEVNAIYSLVDERVLQLELSATSDQETILNLCHHPYFNFSNRQTIDDHTLQIHTDRFLPVDEHLIPTGEILSVAGTKFDFTQPHHVSPSTNASHFNNTYCLPHDKTSVLVRAATLTHDTIEMQLWTSQPGVHLYNGYKLNNVPPGLNNQQYGPRAGLCLEAQNWPNSPNFSHFPSAILAAGVQYTQKTEYRFSLKR